MYSHRTISGCGVCGSTELSTILDLGNQPLAEDFQGRGARYPLILLECSKCGLVQLTFQADQEMVFPPDHPYATGNTRALQEHFRDLMLTTIPALKVYDLWVDIGANDGTLLEQGIGHGLRLLAVEPTNQALKAKEKGLLVAQDYFSLPVAQKIRHQHGRAKVITACNVLAHVPDPHEFMKAVADLLDRDGILILENHDWPSISEGLQIDTVYHEHLRYWSIRSLSYLLELHGFRVVSSVPIPTHGGSFRVVAKRRQTMPLETRASQAKIHLRAALRRAKSEGPVYGIGAATRAVPLLYYAELQEFLECVVEVPTSEKIGRCMPGTMIPVVDEQRLFDDHPPNALLFSWHIADTIVPKLRSAGYRGRIIVPLPEPRIM